MVTGDTSAPNATLYSYATAAASQLRNFMSAEEHCSANSSVAYAASGAVVLGMFVGGLVQNYAASEILTQLLQNHIATGGIRESVLFQYCGNYTKHSVGIVVSTADNALGDVQHVLQSWNEGRCVDTANAVELQTPQELWKFPVPTLPAYVSNITDMTRTNVTSNNTTFANNQTTTGKLHSERRVVGGHSHHVHSHLGARASCPSYKVVVSGDSCATLVTKCGITAALFYQYNPASHLCSTLKIGQVVCCSSGTPPDLTPKPLPDGTCFTFEVTARTFCAEIATDHYITVAQIESVNGRTWGWMGCARLQAGQRICLSTGNPPMPAPVTNALCGPQVPGTPKPTGSTTLTSLNPCPLNACCNIWGQCGTTEEFCTISQSDTGAPGTAAAGKNGCISNCGTAIANNADPPSQFRRIGYFEAWNWERPCLHMDALEIDTTLYTHVRFAFATITPDFEVDLGQNADQFAKFLQLKGVKRILSFGGWSFSTDQDTFPISEPP